MNLTFAISNRIKQLLKEKKLSQLQLYIASGVPESTISTILTGKVKTLKVETLNQICKGLKIDLADFFDHPLFKNN